MWHRQPESCPLEAHLRSVARQRQSVSRLGVGVLDGLVDQLFFWSVHEPLVQSANNKEGEVDKLHLIHVTMYPVRKCKGHF